MSNAVRTITSAAGGHYRDSGRDRAAVDHELLIAGALFAALVIIGTAFFFAVAPSIADIATLYVPTT